MTFNDVFMSTFLDFEITGFSLDSVKPIIYLYLRTGTIVHLSYDDRTLAVSDYVRCKVLDGPGLGPEATGQRPEASGPRLEAGKPEASGKVVIIESPYRGKKAHLHYARACLYDSLAHGESPIMSHLLYPQVLTDRQAGLDAHFRILRELSAGGQASVIFYTDFGTSDGMQRVLDAGIPVTERRQVRHPYCDCVYEVLEKDYVYFRNVGHKTYRWDGESWFPLLTYQAVGYSRILAIQSICDHGLWYPMPPEHVIQDGWNAE